MQLKRAVHVEIYQRTMNPLIWMCNERCWGKWIAFERQHWVYENFVIWRGEGGLIEQCGLETSHTHDMFMLIFRRRIVKFIGRAIFRGVDFAKRRFPVQWKLKWVLCWGVEVPVFVTLCTSAFSQYISGYVSFLINLKYQIEMI